MDPTKRTSVHVHTCTWYEAVVTRCSVAGFFEAAETRKAGYISFFLFSFFSSPRSDIFFFFSFATSAEETKGPPRSSRRAISAELHVKIELDRAHVCATPLVPACEDCRLLSTHYSRPALPPRFLFSKFERNPTKGDISLQRLGFCRIFADLRANNGELFT